MSGRQSTEIAIRASRSGKRARPSAAIVPTRDEMTPTARAIVTLLVKAWANCGLSSISRHQRSEGPVIGKLVSARSENAKTITSSIGVRRKIRKSMAMARQVHACGPVTGCVPITAAARR